jgi:hypothetical protein
MKSIWPVVRTREKRNTCRVLMGRPRGMRPLGKPRRTWEDNIKMDHMDIIWELFLISCNS